MNRRLVIVPILMLGLLGSVSSDPSGTTVCASDRLWVKFQKFTSNFTRVYAGGMPDTFEEVAVLDEAQKKAIWRSDFLSPEQRYSIYEEHRRYILRENRLTPKQIGVVNNLFDWITVDRIESHERIPASLVLAIKQNFPDRKDVDRLFLTIGRYTPTIASNKVASLTPVGGQYCANMCSSESDWCDTDPDDHWTTTCKQCSDNGGFGCGTMLWYACNGNCFGVHDDSAHDQ